MLGEIPVQAYSGRGEEGLPFFRRVAFELLALAVRILPIGDIRKKLGRGDTVEILTARPQAS
ncbi:hypothetical protein ACFC26_24045 [Kitasatospora purpeofusca]|uniref:hypothetical protein n=1 Tax=Kitasatospora purpeofusca TaxID=67352 RepID=UPI0035E19A82